MEVQKLQLQQSRWSTKRTKYLKHLLHDISDTSTPRTVLTDTTVNSYKKSVYTEYEQKIDQHIKLLHKSNVNNELKLPRFAVKDVRSQTAYETINLKDVNTETNTYNLQRADVSLKGAKKDDSYDAYLKQTRNSYTLQIQSYLNPTPKLVSDDTSLSIKSASSLRSQVQKTVSDEVVKHKNYNNYSHNISNAHNSNEDNRKRSTGTCVRRKTVHITLQYEVEKFHVNSKNKRSSPEKVAELIKRFKKAVKKLLTVINVITTCKQKYDKNSNMTIFKSSNNNEHGKDLVFDKNAFKRTKEKTLPEDIKKILRMNHENRNEDRIRLALTAINQIVPEFEEFPQQIQKSFVKYGFYEEYEPGRIILREGHIASSCYFIISGTVMVTVISNDDLTGEIKNRPISFLKRGNTFGDNALINNSRRNNTVISHGDYAIGLLSIFKEDFFRFSSPLPNFEDKKMFLNSHVPIFNMIKYPADSLNIFSDKGSNTVYYKKGTIISKDSFTDEWLYIVKSGKCRVIKTITINEVARSNYNNLKHKREQNFLKVLEVNENISEDKSIENTSNVCKNEKLNSPQSKIRLEIECLKEGDIFGLRDLIFSEVFNFNPVALLSDGAECILIDRKQFKKNLNEISLGVLKISLIPYPDDEYLLKKYFDREDWNNYKKINLSNTIRRINLNK